MESGEAIGSTIKKLNLLSAVLTAARDSCELDRRRGLGASIVTWGQHA